MHVANLLPIQMMTNGAIVAIASEPNLSSIIASSKLSSDDCNNIKFTNKLFFYFYCCIEHNYNICEDQIGLLSSNKSTK